MVEIFTNWFKLDDTSLTRLRQVWVMVNEKGQFRIWTNGIWNVPFLNVQSWTTLRPLAWFSIFLSFRGRINIPWFYPFLPFLVANVCRLIKRSILGLFTLSFTLIFLYLGIMCRGWRFLKNVPEWLKLFCCICVHFLKWHETETHKSALKVRFWVGVLRILW